MTSSTTLKVILYKI